MSEGGVAGDVGDPDAVSKQVRAVADVVAEGEVDAVTDDVAGADQVTPGCWYWCRLWCWWRVVDCARDVVDDAVWSSAHSIGIQDWSMGEGGVAGDIGDPDAVSKQV